MKEFDALCKEFEQMDALTYGALLAEKSATLIPALSAITEDGVGGVAAFATFVLGAIAADGKLAEEEYVMLHPMLTLFFGENVDYDSCRKALKIVKSEAKDLKDAVDVMADVLGELDEEMKNDVVLVCLMICAVDGKVSRKEKQWIKQLIK